MFQEYQNNKLVMFNKANFRDKKEYIFDDAGNIPVIEEIKQELNKNKQELDKTKQELDKNKQELNAEKIVSLTYKQQLENNKKQLTQFSDTVKCELDKTKQELDAEKIVSLTYKQQLENVKKQLTQFLDTGDIGRIKSYNFSYSKCTYCKIKDVKLEVLSYRNIIKHIYSIIDDEHSIIKNTVLFVKTTGPNVKNEFTHLWKLGINTQGISANESLEEIIKQCTSNYISYDIKITLLTGEIVEFKKCF